MCRQRVHAYEIFENREVNVTGWIVVGCTFHGCRVVGRPQSVFNCVFVGCHMEWGV